MIIDEGQENSYKQDSITQQIFVPIVEPLRAELMSFYHAVVNNCPVEVDGLAATKAIAICESIAKSAMLPAVG